MNRWFVKGLIWLLTSTLIVSLSVAAAGKFMLDLTQVNEAKQWRATNDNVMGGISQGGMAHNGKHSVFRGDLSLENNGGFSSINRPVDALPASVSRVKVMVAGDGRRYQLRLTSWVDGYRVTYKREFDTVAGEIVVREFALEEFLAVFRGRLIVGAPELKAEDIRLVGFLIADKRAGEFELGVMKIEFL